MSRYNEPNYPNPRLTFGEILIDGNGGSIRLYADGKITVQKLGEAETEHFYTFENKNFGGDCVFFTQKHFIEGILSKKPFDTEGGLFEKYSPSRSDLSIVVVKLNFFQNYLMVILPLPQMRVSLWQIELHEKNIRYKKPCSTDGFGFNHPSSYHQRCHLSTLGFVSNLPTLSQSGR
jgi:hypothetical protein